MTKVRILYVDDDASNRLTFSALLEDEGFEVEEAASFAEAKQVLESGRQWRIVLLDYRLGDGIGTALVPLVRERVPRAKVVMLSGSMTADRIPEKVDAALVKGGNASVAIDLLKQLAEE